VLPWHLKLTDNGMLREVASEEVCSYSWLLAAALLAIAVSGMGRPIYLLGTDETALLFIAPVSLR
jgi:hypothetical protein